jgi:AcrR family transcriptional regulator
VADASGRQVGGSRRRGRASGRPRGGPAHVSRGGGRGPAPPALAPRKEPRQARARATVAAILGAAAQLFAARGYAGANTNLVAARAGVSVGSLYQYFPNKEALLAALYQRHRARTAAVVGRALARLADPGVPLEESLGGLLTELQEVHDQDPELTRVVSEQVPQVARLELLARAQEEASVAEVEASLRARADLRAGDRRVMAHVLARAAEAMTRWLAHDLPPGLDRRGATAEVARLLVRYLRD